MKITGLELFKVPPRWLFLKVTTDDGVTGWSEPVVEGRADTVRAASAISGIEQALWDINGYSDGGLTWSRQHPARL